MGHYSMLTDQEIHQLVHVQTSLKQGEGLLGLIGLNILCRCADMREYMARVK